MEWGLELLPVSNLKHLKQHFVTAATAVYVHIRHAHMKMCTYIANVDIHTDIYTEIHISNI